MGYFGSDMRMEGVVYGVLQPFEISISLNGILASFTLFTIYKFTQSSTDVLTN